MLIERFYKASKLLMNLYTPEEHNNLKEKD